MNLILDTANARAKQSDPGFDLRKTLLANLGDDIIRYERAPRGNTPTELQSPPSLLLIGSPNPEQLAIALKRLFVIFPQGDAPVEREFLGRKIFSVPVPPLPFLMTGPTTRPAPPGTLSCAAGGSYVAMSTDVAFLEEYLRSSESQGKDLREKPGLLEAAQKVGGMGTGLLGYENEAESMRAAFDAVKNDPGATTNGIGPSLLPGLPGITGPREESEPVDRLLAPAFLRQGGPVFLSHGLCNQRGCRWPHPEAFCPGAPCPSRQSGRQTRQLTPACTASVEIEARSPLERGLDNQLRRALRPERQTDSAQTRYGPLSWRKRRTAQNHAFALTRVICPDNLSTSLGRSSGRRSDRLHLSSSICFCRASGLGEAFLASSSKPIARFRLPSFSSRRARLTASWSS